MLNSPKAGPRWGGPELSAAGLEVCVEALHVLAHFFPHSWALLL